MLVLSRKVGERIQIGDGVVLTVLSIQGRQVRLGLEAPVSVPIRRAELAPNLSPPPRDGHASHPQALSRR